MHTVVINFTAEASAEKFNASVKQDAPMFAKIHDLIYKIFSSIIKIRPLVR